MIMLENNNNSKEKDKKERRMDTFIMIICTPFKFKTLKCTLKCNEFLDIFKCSIITVCLDPYRLSCSVFVFRVFKISFYCPFMLLSFAYCSYDYWWPHENHEIKHRYQMRNIIPNKSNFSKTMNQLPHLNCEFVLFF